jgi:hypothetical protein
LVVHSRPHTSHRQSTTSISIRRLLRITGDLLTKYPRWIRLQCPWWILQGNAEEMCMGLGQHFSENTEPPQQPVTLITVAYITRRTVEVRTGDPEEALRQFQAGFIQGREVGMESERQIESVVVRKGTDGRVKGSR